MGKVLTVITYISENEVHLQRCVKGLEQQKVPFKWLLLGQADPISVKTELDFEYVKLPAECKNKAAAYNFILPKIDSTYIALNDADDISLVSRFAKQLDYLNRNEEVDILGGQLIINEEKLGWHSYSSDVEIKAFMLLNNPMVNSTVMFRNKPNFWGKQVHYDEQYQRAEDYEFWLSCAKEKLTFANLDIPLISYLQEPQRPKDRIQMREADTTREGTYEMYSKVPLDEELKELYHQFANKQNMKPESAAKVQKLLIEIYPEKGVMRRILKRHQSSKARFITVRKLLGKLFSK